MRRFIHSQYRGIQRLVFRNWPIIAGHRIENPRVCCYRFANPRLSTKKTDRSRHDAATKHTVDLAIAGAEALVIAAAHICQQHRLSCQRATRRVALATARSAGDDGLDVRVPRPTLGAATDE